MGTQVPLATLYSSDRESVFDFRDVNVIRGNFTFLPLESRDGESGAKDIVKVAIITGESPDETLYSVARLNIDPFVRGMTMRGATEQEMLLKFENFVADSALDDFIDARDRLAPSIDDELPEGTWNNVLVDWIATMLRNDGIRDTFISDLESCAKYYKRTNMSVSTYVTLFKAGMRLCREQAGKRDWPKLVTFVIYLWKGLPREWRADFKHDNPAGSGKSVCVRDMLEYMEQKEARERIGSRYDDRREAKLPRQGRKKPSKPQRYEDSERDSRYQDRRGGRPDKRRKVRDDRPIRSGKGRGSRSGRHENDRRRSFRNERWEEPRKDRRREDDRRRDSDRHREDRSSSKRGEKAKRYSQGRGNDRKPPRREDAFVGEEESPPPSPSDKGSLKAEETEAEASVSSGASNSDSADAYMGDAVAAKDQVKGLDDSFKQLAMTVDSDPELDLDKFFELDAQEEASRLEAKEAAKANAKADKETAKAN